MLDLCYGVCQKTPGSVVVKLGVSGGRRAQSGDFSRSPDFRAFLACWDHLALSVVCDFRVFLEV